jgi:hypothetical protein
MSRPAVARRYPPGQLPKDLIPGDIGVSRSSPSALSQLIQGGERARYGNVDAARWNHSWLVIGNIDAGLTELALHLGEPDGDIVEANKTGVERKNIEEYREHDFMIISPSGIDAEGRRLACEFMLGHVGDQYGIMNFVCLATQALFGWTIAFHVDNQFTCSGAVSRATEKYVASYQRSPESMTPADLVVFWRADSGEPLIPLSAFSRLLDRVSTIVGIVFCRDLPAK